MHDPELLIRTSGEERISQLPALAARLHRARTSATSCGPTSAPDDLDEALADLRRARRAGSAAAERRRRAARRPAPATPAERGAVARHARHRRRRARACSRSSSSIHGGLLFFVVASRVALHRHQRVLPLMRPYRPLRWPASSAWCSCCDGLDRSPQALMGDRRPVAAAVVRLWRPCRGPSPGVTRAHGRSPCSGSSTSGFGFAPSRAASAG